MYDRVDEDSDSIDYIEEYLTEDQIEYIRDKSGIESFHFEASPIMFNRGENPTCKIVMKIISDNKNSHGLEMGYVVFEVSKEKSKLIDFEEFENTSFGFLVGNVIVKEINVFWR